MKCFICNKKSPYLKSINNVKIYNCLDCQVAIVDNKKVNKKNIKKKYKFKDYLKQELLLKNRFKKLSSIIFRYKNNGRLLDIGAGFGLFTSVIDKLGKYNIDIIEPEQEIKYFKKATIYKSKLENFLKYKHKKYDIVTMFDVIEHFADPMENLCKIKKLINNSSILVIQTPNYKSLMAIFCKNWSWWMVEDHKYLFSPKSINKILKITGYKIKYFMTYENFIDFKKNLDGNFTSIKGLLLRRLIKGLYYSFFIPFYIIFRGLFWELGYGGLIFLIAERERI